jgi:outer membrane protein assembly factor BamB
MVNGSRSLKVLCCLVLLLLLFLCMGPIGQSSAMRTRSATEVNQFRGDNSNSGVCESKGIPTDEQVWKFKTDNMVYSTPAVVGGKVYFGSHDNSVYCVDMATGIEVWRFATEDPVESSPLVRAGKCYIGSGDGNVYCLNAGYGTDQWRFETGGKVVSSPKFYKDQLYFGSDDGKFYSVYADNGTEAWNFTMLNRTQEFWSTAAISDGRVFVGDYFGRFVVLEASNGSLVDEIEIEGDIYTTACFFGDELVISAGIGRSVLKYRFEDDKLVKVWEFKTEHDSYTSAAVHNGSVYISDYVNVYSFPFEDPNDDGEISEDEINWKFPIYNRDGGSSPLIVGDRLVIGTEDFLFCLFLNGTEDWSLEQSGKIIASPVYVDHYLYYASSDGHMYCLRGMAIGEEEEIIDEDDPIEFDPLLTTLISIFLVLDVAVLVVIIVVLVKKRRSGKDVGA